MAGERRIFAKERFRQGFYNMPHQLSDMLANVAVIGTLPCLSQTILTKLILASLDQHYHEDIVEAQRSHHHYRHYWRWTARSQHMPC